MPSANGRRLGGAESMVQGRPGGQLAAPRPEPAPAMVLSFLRAPEMAPVSRCHSSCPVWTPTAFSVLEAHYLVQPGVEVGGADPGEGCRDRSGVGCRPAGRCPG